MCVRVSEFVLRGWGRRRGDASLCVAMNVNKSE